MTTSPSNIAREEQQLDRLSKQMYFMIMARMASLRGTCVRRTVGCIITDVNNHVVSTGYNGSKRGEAHCIEVPCPGAFDKHGDCGRCVATHAEANALDQCGTAAKLLTARTMYCTDSPCIDCAKMIAKTLIKKVIYARPYTREGLECLRDFGVGVISDPRVYQISLSSILSSCERPASPSLRP